jgi:hypothetical protein
MIDSVRQTVQALLNKNNYGYLSPSDFNLFALQAQMDIFVGYFTKYNAHINAENNRAASRGGQGSGTGLANLSQEVAEAIETFSVAPTALAYLSANQYTLPENLYLLQSVRTSPAPGTPREVERVEQQVITTLLGHRDLTPSVNFPAYVLSGPSLYLYPESIAGAGLLKAQYIRVPEDPKWTYSTLSGGEPIFNPSQSDYQDFELPLEEEVNLVMKILQMAGLSIRETEVVAATQQRSAQ